MQFKDFEKLVEKELVQAFKLGMLDATPQSFVKPDPLPALRERGNNIIKAAKKLK